MSNYITAIDPLVQENNNFFHADEKMHYILENKDIQTYLDYIKNKHISSKSEILPEIKPRYTHDSNKYKKQMLNNIWTNIENLEKTINQFKNIK
jgi:hypothetical protein